MRIEQIHLAKSALTDQIYVGILDKDGLSWKDKKEVTNEFIAVAIQRWGGFEETITGSSGKVYRISIKEITEE